MQLWQVADPYGTLVRDIYSNRAGEVVSIVSQDPYSVLVIWDDDSRSVLWKNIAINEVIPPLVF